MASELDLVIEVGHDITAIKYYALATCTILFYDYLLTLADEINYAWSAKKSWAFWLFVVVSLILSNDISILVAQKSRPIVFTPTWRCKNSDFCASMPSHSLRPRENRCERTVWYPLFVGIVCTLFVQVTLMLRIYAVTVKSIPITVGFGIITIVQLVFGTIWSALTQHIDLLRHGDTRAVALPVLQIPLDAYRVCVFTRHRPIEITCIGISLFYEFLTFSLIIFLAATSKTPGIKVPRIMGVIVKDATWYFLVIFTSHFVLMLTLTLGRESIQLLPAPGNAAYLPVMISRTMLSLRKAADPQRGDWHIGEPAKHVTNLQSIRFFHQRSATNGREDSIVLDVYPVS
ncbi:hypothetical protein BJ322DRAFT_1105503 [Thelephora terrestris]|uniref:DUF6533 domain-containing protein n=1 Tax=Thelephora terrestris TaxID=56493 RepID=A0A9P6LAC5_9AGAM|nr:hypothetical protein BJ322DRAFT_1105503 [Thelephora terrestris]